MVFQGFQPQDFDAFVPKKQGSNAYTLERRSAKAKLLEVAEHFREVGSDGLENLVLETTEDVPSVANGRKVRFLAAYFVRPPQVRDGIKELRKTNLTAGSALFEIAAHQQHAHLALGIDAEGLTVSVRIPAQAFIDRENANEKLALEWALEDLSDLLQALPAAAECGFEGQVVPCADVQPSTVGEWKNGFGSAAGPWTTELRIPRTSPTLCLPQWLDEGAALLRAHLPILSFLAWSKTNDHTRVQQAVAKTLEATETKMASTGIQPGDRVTILGGLFAGRAGMLAEVDHKGKAKVMVGPVTVSVPVEDLKPAG